AVDVVVAVNGDALAARDGGQDALDRHAHVGEAHGIVKVIERGVQEVLRALGVGEAALTQKARDDGRDADRGREPLCGSLVAYQRLPSRSDDGRHQTRPNPCSGISLHSRKPATAEDTEETEDINCGCTKTSREWPPCWPPDQLQRAPFA